MAETRMFHYALTVDWTGAHQGPTTSYTAYARDYVICAPGKPEIAGSSDPAFRGDPGSYNPEELLLAALSACHMLWYLHLAAEAGIEVLAYRDRPKGEMAIDEQGGGRFVRACLAPQIVIAEKADKELAAALHEAAHAKCFIANSVNFPVDHRPRIENAGHP